MSWTSGVSFQRNSGDGGYRQVLKGRRLMARGRIFYIILGGRFCFREAVQAVQGQDDSTPPPDSGMQRTTLVARWKLEIFFPTLSTIEVAVLASLRNCPKSVDRRMHKVVSACVRV